MNLAEWAARARAAERSAHKILAVHETARSRVVLLEDLAKRLSGAPIDVQNYFKEAVACLEYGLYRAGIVTAWAGHFHMFAEALFQLHEANIRSLRPKWAFKDLHDLKEQYPEAQILDVGKDVKFVGKAKLRVLQGQLAQRNQCAHPTLYRPSMNAAIGYVDELVEQTLTYVTP